MPSSSLLPGSGPRTALAKAVTTLLSLLVVAVPAGVGRDILRPVGGAGNGGTGAKPSTHGVAPVTDRTSISGGDMLARTTRAVQAVQGMQQAARNAALKSGGSLGTDPAHPGQALPVVPNGLVAGGLQVAPGAAVNSALWRGAALPVQSSLASGATTVTIKQNSSQAVLNWKTFNIGKQTEVDFDQSAGGKDAGKWVAFNLIADPSGRPSQILGRMHADGQVYLINQNGIIFGGSGQISLHGLVASSLPINTNLIGRGLLNNPDDQFLFSSLAIPALPNGGTTPAFTPPAAPSTSTGRDGDIVVQSGAVISTPGTADHVGGRVALIAPNVTNAGTISTPDGQTILAAGNQVAFSAHASSDATLRGLDVLVGAVDGFSGRATNTGLILAPRADTLITGKTVEQLGTIYSSTSVALNGRVDLLANYNATRTFVLGAAVINPAATGTVTLGANSLTTIQPELESDTTAVGVKLALASRINVQGKNLQVEAGGQILAPNAAVSFQAGNWLPARGNFIFGHTGGQITLAPGATIDVSGSVVSAPNSENILAVQLLGAELADSPLQRNSFFHGTTIQIDLRQTGLYGGTAWVGTPLADASGYIGLIQRNVGELTTTGGTVSLQAGTAVNLQKGSTINVSGGWINYQGGMVQTTRVLSGGQLLDISQATPDVVYDGIYTGTFTKVSPTWGVSRTYTNPLLMNGAHYEMGYVYGADGGAVSITAPTVSLQGTLTGRTVSGVRQREVAPVASALSLAFQSQSGEGPLYPAISPTAPLVVFGTSGPAGAVVLSPELLGSNAFGTLTIENGDGRILVPAGVTLAAPARGSVTLSAANLEVQGSITAPSGNISLTAYDFSPLAYGVLAKSATPVTPPADDDRGHFTLGSGALLSTAGLLVDDRGEVSLLPLATAGGTVTIRSYRADLQAGSTIDVSGGLVLNLKGKQSFGAGGSIVIEAGRDPNIASLTGGSLTLHGSLRGYSGTTGGSLSILAPGIQVGSTGAADPTLQLGPEFFRQGGFSSYTLTGLEGGVLIAAGTAIAPRAENFVFDPETTSLKTELLPQAERTPVSLSFKAPGVRDTFSGLLLTAGRLEEAAGARIETEPGASVAFKGDLVDVEGAIVAPGGAISVAGANIYPSAVPKTVPLSTVVLGTHSFLSAAGTTVETPDLTGRGATLGTVLAGGTITVSGNVTAQRGAVLNVSGASSVLDVRTSQVVGSQAPTGSFAGYTTTPVTIDSNGGSIVLTGAQQLLSQATLIGAAGGASALGGTLTIRSGRFQPAEDSTPQTPLQVTLRVSQQFPAVAASGLGQVAVNDFAGGGFDSVTLGGTVQFTGPVSLSVPGNLAAADGGVIYADGAVRLAAAHASLGTSFLAPQQAAQIVSAFTVANSPFRFAPTSGSGSLTVTASLIDVGNLSLQKIGSVALNGGEVRGDGTLDVAGRLSITAGQIYPVTAASFTLSAGSIDIHGTGLSQTPLSAGGTLNLYASDIYIGGTLRAPLGTINVGWDGTGTAPLDLISGQPVAKTQKVMLAGGSLLSVSAWDPVTQRFLTIPYGLNLNGTSWIDPAGNDITAGGVPAKAIHIAGQSVYDLAGSSIDLRGGGDLLAYRFQSGVSGTSDVLGSTGSFAIVPGYVSAWTPYAPFNPQPLADNFVGDPGYVNAKLKAGDRIHLGASTNGLDAGDYTLLPARYALLPGAFLITSSSSVPVGTQALPTGASLVAGYRFQDTQAAPAVQQHFEVASGDVVRQRAQYDVVLANSFLSQSALRNSAAVPRLPMDGGQLVLQATTAMTLRGTVQAQATSGLGGLVDISSPVDIVIAGAHTAATPGVLVLEAGELSAFGASSLLIGGVRHGGEVTVTTGHLLADNAGTPLSGADLILAATSGVTLASGAVVESKGSGTAEALHFTGDGALLRVSSDAGASTSRSGITVSTDQSLVLSAGSRVTGASIVLDSTGRTTLDSRATLEGESISLSSGQISLQLSGAAPSTTGLILSTTALATLRGEARSLGLQSYSTLDLYGSGTVGSAQLATLLLRAGEVRGFGGDVVFQAQNVRLDRGSAALTTTALPQAGSLMIDGGLIRVGTEGEQISGFAQVSLRATGGAQAGTLATAGDLTIQAPVLTAASGSENTMSAGGRLSILPAAGQPTLAAGLAASLTLTGSSVDSTGFIALPSGRLTLHATSGDLTAGGRLEAGGTVRTFNDLIRTTPSGSISLTADGGSVLASGSLHAADVSIQAPQGTFTLTGTLSAAGAGSFALDVGTLPEQTFFTALQAGGFTQSVSIRDRHDSAISLTAPLTAQQITFAADTGSLTIADTLTAIGRITLLAAGTLTLADGAHLTVGNTGRVSLETASTLDLQAGSTIELGTAGTLHLRAPQTTGDLQITQVHSTITGGSARLAEGYRTYTPADGSIDSVEGTIFADATAFGAQAGAIASRLGGNFEVIAGAEILNPTGNLTLHSDWDLSTFRFGPDGAAGQLTLRAAGDLVFLGALSDGFTSASYNAALLARNASLPLSAQSWSYRLAAGSDFTAVDFRAVNPLAGSLLLGVDGGLNITNSGANGTTGTVVAGHYQVIRTGSGDIDIAVGKDVQLLNQFATIYTAGTQVADPTLGGTFVIPKLVVTSQGGLGAVQERPFYPAQYSEGGGDVFIQAGQDIIHLTRDNSGALVADSEKELPNNWLYRRGYIDPLTGNFGKTRNGDVASTTWWVDFSNFFEGVGALGGGDVHMAAGRDVVNVDAVVPTNARMPGGRPNAAGLVELGGGNLTVTAGRDLSGGAYYVERGEGTLVAGRNVLTNSTRSPSLNTITVPAKLEAPESWLPTTLFLGKGNFSVTAGKDLLLGPVANPFLLPQGVSNTFWDKTYFSTYAASDRVSASSLTGSVTLRESDSLGGSAPEPLLLTWLRSVSLLSDNPVSVSFYQPWLRLAEADVAPFKTMVALQPGSLEVNAFQGNVNIVGDLTLSPSARGSLEIAAAGSISALQPNGVSSFNNVTSINWGSATINLSDTDPALVPGVASPYAYQLFAGINQSAASKTDPDFLLFFDAFFAESGSSTGAQAVLQTKQALHAPGLLHAGDPLPVRFYAGQDISGLTLFSPKAARVIAGRDLTDVALYLQNTSATDLSIVAAGRDIIAYDPTSPLRVAAQAVGNALDLGALPMAGDFQLSGPGTLEVLAGRELDLGVGPSRADGTAVGITSIGNARNPALPFAGADIVAGAGVDYRLLDSAAKLADLNELYQTLRQVGRDHVTAGTSYDAGFAAIAAFFASPGTGDISLTSREIKTQSGGQISLLAPGGKLTVGYDIAGNQPVDQGILTEDGGNIYIFTDKDVVVGTSRIFTLRGGDELIWSSTGDIAAGAASRTVQSAPPTRVLIDPQSSDVQTDLAGLATGGGIGVLESVAGVPAGNVDLIAPLGTVDAGDAGIRVSGQLNIAAAHVLNTASISAAGGVSGVPAAPAVAAPNLAGAAAASSAAGATNSAAQTVMNTSHDQPVTAEIPSLITAEVLGYGGPGEEQ